MGLKTPSSRDPLQDKPSVLEGLGPRLSGFEGYRRAGSRHGRLRRTIPVPSSPTVGEVEPTLTLRTGGGPRWVGVA